MRTVLDFTCSCSGSVSELVAKWLSTTGVDPTRLIDTTDVEFDQLQLSVNSLQSNDALEEATEVEVPQQEHTKLLSLSVEIGDEAKVNTTAEACILGKIYLREITLLDCAFNDFNLSFFLSLFSRQNDSTQTPFSVQLNEQCFIGQFMLGVCNVVE